MDLYGKVISYACKNEGNEWVRYFTLITQDGKKIDCMTTLYLPLLVTDVVLVHCSEKVSGCYKITDYPCVRLDPGEDLVNLYFNKALPKASQRKELLPFYEWLVRQYGSSNPMDIVHRIEDLVMQSDRGSPLSLDFSPPFLEAIYSWFRKNVCIRRFQLMNLLKDEIKDLFNCYDIPPYLIHEKIMKNPYCLYPVGAEGCDRAFKTMRYVPDVNTRRFGLAMIQLYDYVKVKGWTCIPYRYIPEDIITYKDAYTKEYDLVWFHDFVYFPITHKVETGIAKWFKERLCSKNMDQSGRQGLCSKNMDQSGRIILDDKVDEALANNITIIMGEAGTGKTTLISKIIKKIVENDKTFHICSFTGKAVQRAMEVLEKSGLECPAEAFSTIHRLIMDRKKMDYLIIDETSMVSMPLFYSLINILDPVTKVIFVGDPNQLEPIDWGHLMEEMVISKVLDPHIIRLTTVYRQVEGSGLMYNIRAILDHKNMVDGNGFDIRPCKNIEINDELTTVLEYEYSVGQSVMVLSPYGYKLKDVNDIGRDITIPNASLITDKFGNRFAKGDRVMLTTNDLNEGGQGSLFNGDEGIITDILGMISVKWNRTGEIINYDPNNDYDNDEMSISLFGTGSGRRTNSTKCLQVCYGITCHKSQGSEWDAVVIVNPWKKDSSDFINRRLIYTSITRARHRCYIIGDVRSMNMTIKGHNVRTVTLLPYNIDN